MINRNLVLKQAAVLIETNSVLYDLQPGLSRNHLNGEILNKTVLCDQITAFDREWFQSFYLFFKRAVGCAGVRCPCPLHREYLKKTSKFLIHSFD